MNWQPWSIYKGLTWAYTDSWERHVYAHLFPPNVPPINTYTVIRSAARRGTAA